MDCIIVGIDGGVTSAYAVLDYEGRVVKIKSRKNWPIAEIVKDLISFSPSVVACDTNPPSKLACFVQKIFSSRLWFPKQSLTHAEKSELAENISHRNNHERDATAAALKAYNALAGKLRQIKRRASLRDVGVEKALRVVLAGKKLSELISEGLQTQSTSSEYSEYDRQQERLKRK